MIKPEKMTKEEAVRLLKHIRIAFVPADEYGDYEDPEPYEEAIDMAIKALDGEDMEDFYIALAALAEYERTDR